MHSLTEDARDRRTHGAIVTGIAIPIFYFGLQLVAMPFARQYDFVRQTASELGMIGVSSAPAVFNLGKILGTIPTWIAAFGFLFGLRRLGARPIATWLCFIGLVAIALSDIE